MTTAIKRLEIVAKAPDSKGTFDGSILFNPTEGDSDGERVADFEDFPTSVPLSYQHAIGGDPGAIIGEMFTSLDGDSVMEVSGKLNLDSKMAQAIHERMLLPDSDPLALKELSIGFAYDPALNTKDANGVVAIHKAVLLEISVVYRGAQETRVSNVKALMADVSAQLISYEVALKYAADCDVPSDIAEKMIESVLPQVEPIVEPVEEKVEEGDKWDGQAAMQSCSSAADFRKIAFEKNNDSDPDTAAHWGLPHHQAPGDDADPQGVSSALGALGGARSGESIAGQYKPSADEMRSHLEAHQASFDKDESKEAEMAEAGTDEVTEPVTEGGEKAGRVLSKANETKLRDAADALVAAAEAIKGVLDTVTSTEADGEEPAADEKQETEEDSASKADDDLRTLLDTLEA